MFLFHLVDAVMWLTWVFFFHRSSEFQNLRPYEGGVHGVPLRDFYTTLPKCEFIISQQGILIEKGPRSCLTDVAPPDVKVSCCWIFLWSTVPLLLRHAPLGRTEFSNARKKKSWTLAKSHGSPFSFTVGFSSLPVHYKLTTTRTTAELQARAARRRNRKQRDPIIIK